MSGKEIGLYLMHKGRNTDLYVADCFVKYDEAIVSYKAYGNAYGLEEYQYFPDCPYVKAFLEAYPEYRYVGTAGQYLYGDNAGKFNADLSKWKNIGVQSIDKLLVVNNMKNVCYLCGMELHKDRQTERMRKKYGETWKDNEGNFGLHNRYHWHYVKKEVK